MRLPLTCIALSILTFNEATDDLYCSVNPQNAGCFQTDSSKAERTEEETRQERAASDAKPDHEALRACTLPASYREEILANIANEDEKRKSLERVTGGKVPVSQQRPRSNSGSRFLTDKVRTR